MMAEEYTDYSGDN